MKSQNYVVVLLSFAFVVAGVLFVKSLIHSNDIDIHTSETEEELVVSASFPKEDTELVHNYIRTQLKMSDVPDMTHLEVKDYITPDARMRFYIKSRPGYIKIVLDRTENSTYAYRKLKNTGKGIEKVLAQN